MAHHIARASFWDSAQCPLFITHRVQAAQVKTLLKLICAFNGDLVLKWDVVRRNVAVLLSQGNPDILFKGDITVIVRCTEISGFTPCIHSACYSLMHELRGCILRVSIHAAVILLHGHLGKERNKQQSKVRNLVEQGNAPELNVEFHLICIWPVCDFLMCWKTNQKNHGH